MTKPTDAYIPALRFGWLTRFYDPVVALTTRERTFKQRLLEQARIEPSQRVLDLGCGTGTLAIWAIERQPLARVTGLDGDPEILARAVRKAADAGVAAEFDFGLSFELPYEDNTFDLVLSSLFFHHLSPGDKRRTLREVFRVLRPGGELHVADWGKASDPLMRVLFLSIQLLDGFANTEQHVAGALPALVAGCGFVDVDIRESFRTMYGTLSLMSARKPK